MKILEANIIFILAFITVLYLRGELYNISSKSIIYFIISYTIYYWYMFIRTIKPKMITKESDEIDHPVK